MNRLSFDEFCHEVLLGVQNQLPEGYSVTFKDTMKNNDQQLRGLSFSKEGEKANPSLYLEGAYADYLNGQDMSRIVNMCCSKGLDAVNNVPVEIMENIDKFFDHDFAKDRIRAQLVNIHDNRLQLSELAHKQVSDDFALIYREEIKNGMSIVIRNEHLQSLQMDVNDLDIFAAQNDRDSFALLDIVDVLSRSPQGEMLSGNGMLPRGFMYVGIHKENDQSDFPGYGAVCITDPSYMDRVRDLIGEDYAIVPSSIFEVLFVPFDRDNIPDPEQLVEIIGSVNQSELEPTEKLGDRAYMYDYDSNKIITMEEGIEHIHEQERTREREHDVEMSIA